VGFKGLAGGLGARYVLRGMCLCVCFTVYVLQCMCCSVCVTVYVLWGMCCCVCVSVCVSECVTVYVLQCMCYGYVLWGMFRVGQNRTSAPYMTACMVISLPKLPCIHRIYL
jgi:hypothetical protein